MTTNTKIYKGKYHSTIFDDINVMVTSVNKNKNIVYGWVMCHGKQNRYHYRYDTFLEYYQPVL